MATNGNGRLDFERQKFKDELTEIRPILMAFARSLCHDRDLSEDLVQDTLTKAWKHRETFELGSNLKAWLFVILRNELYSGHRRRMTAAAHVAHELTFSNEASESLQISEAEASYQLKQALKYIACLPTDQADALIATAYLDMSYEDAAVLFKCAVGTIKSRVSRGRLELHRFIEGGAITRLPDLDKLQHATRGIPKSHSLYRLAKGYEELYANFTAEDFVVSNVVVSALQIHYDLPKELSQSEKDWQELVASGALDREMQDARLADLMQGDPDQF